MAFAQSSHLLLCRLIAMHQSIAHRQEEEITSKLDALSGWIAETLMRIKLQENVWLNARSVVAREIRSLIADDARCLLPVIHFQRFVSDTLAHELLVTVSDPGISSNTANWLLLSTSTPLKLSNFRNCDREQGNQYRLELELGNWRQSLQVPLSARQRSDLPDTDWDCLFQWQCLVNQLNPEGNSILAFDPAQQERLKREVACVIVYLAQLLHRTSAIDSFTYP